MEYPVGASGPSLESFQPRPGTRITFLPIHDFEADDPTAFTIPHPSARRGVSNDGAG